MGNKVFVSYKYRDFTVSSLSGNERSSSRTREYVDRLKDKIELSDHIYKGEEGNNDLSRYTDSTIEEKLKERIADSSVTVVLISPEMREVGKRDRDQWIPWEVAYSLREVTRNGRTSHANVILGVVLPDVVGSYAYMIESRQCCVRGCLRYHIENLFSILKKNTFNRVVPNVNWCDAKEKVHTGEFSYMPIVPWCRFIESPTTFIDRACNIRDAHADEYDICKTVEGE